jgi:hypothetical protein
MVLEQAEPMSFFGTLTLVDSTLSPIGHSAFFYVEIVCPESKVLVERMWPLEEQCGANEYCFSNESKPSDQFPETVVKVMILGNDDWDGQKSIWRQQLLTLPGKGFQFTYALTPTVSRQQGTKSAWGRFLAQTQGIHVINNTELIVNGKRSLAVNTFATKL